MTNLNRTCGNGSHSTENTSNPSVKIITLGFIERLDIPDLIELAKQADPDSDVVKLARAHLIVMRQHHLIDNAEDLTTEFERRKMAEKCESCSGRQKCAYCAGDSPQNHYSKDHRLFMRDALEDNASIGDRQYF